MIWRSARSDVLWNQLECIGAVRVSRIANECVRTGPIPSDEIELPREGAAVCPDEDRSIAGAIVYGKRSATL